MDTVFLIVAKLGWAALRPDTWIVLGLSAAVIGAALGWRRLALWVGGPVLVAVVALAVLPLGDLMLRPLEARFPAAPDLPRVDGIVILGGGEETARAATAGLPQVNDAGERFIAGAALARDWPAARLIFSGGSGALRDIGAAAPNAQLALAILTDLGVDPARVELEGQSRNTAENAALALALADPQPGEVWVLVTSAFHMPRAMRSFQAVGWDGIVPWPVDHRAESFAAGIRWDLTQHLVVLNTAVREYLGLIAYRLTGR